MVERWTISVPDDVAEQVMEEMDYNSNRSEWVVDAIRNKLDEKQHDIKRVPASESETESVDEIDLEELLLYWEPEKEIRATKARPEIVRAAEWLRDRPTWATKSEFQDALAEESEYSKRVWWGRVVRPGLNYLRDEHDLIEYRSGSHDYRWIGDS